MTNQQYLRQSAILSVIALILLLVIGLVSNLGQHLAGQELFEVIIDPAAYAKSIIDATPALRIVLALDAYRVGSGRCFCPFLYGGNLLRCLGF